MIRRAVVYMTAAGTEPYAEFVDSLKDQPGAAKIRTRVVRAELGNSGSHRGVGEGVVELEIDFGPGHRIYVGPQGETSIILLCAGDKSSQDRDIRRALDYWSDYRRRNP